MLLQVLCVFVVTSVSATEETLLTQTAEKQKKKSTFSPLCKILALLGHLDGPHKKTICTSVPLLHNYPQPKHVRASQLHT